MRVQDTCPIAATAKIIAQKWTLLIVRDLMGGPKRFSELERSLQGISPRTLSDRLSHLEREGLVQRRNYSEAPPRVEYSLTTKGRDLLPVIEALRAYGEKWLC